MRCAVLVLVSLATAWAGGLPSFAVVVHKSNSTADLRFSELRAVFVGVSKQWPNGARVVLVGRDSSSPASRFLMERVLNMSSSEYKRRLASIEFSGEVPVNLKVLNSDQAACKFVFNVPGAIALIEANSIRLGECSGVQIVRIDGKFPGEQGYRLR